ncbi:flagellar FliJ family protein [Leifsonia flava]|uniref:Flagellar FliJ protein n=1 Tax=Orlajensenia leifsoniae TaxID=2561933 RepID=A0A4Y9R5U3_9MICO|nr:flagellar FliJ family protein [Leifsonia flava]TFV98825.1 hypothetical protein E4M00_04760 [Leifsonia flava]
MNRTFSLTGLLRLRRLEEETAAVDLSLARERVAEATEREHLVRAALDSEQAPAAVPISALHAIAAARASSRTMLGELNQLSRERDAEAAAAREAHARARQDAGALEKLAERHAAAVELDERRREQIVLDEIASRRRAVMQAGMPAQTAQGENR